MNIYRYTFLIILLAILLIFVAGCWDRGSTVRETAVSEPGIENNNGALVEENVETIARRGSSDRLPGSLQWGSIIIFQNGEDFLLDYPDQGLRAVSLVSITGKTTDSGETSASAENEDTATTSTKTESTETENDETESDETESDETESTENDGFSGVKYITDENGITKEVIYRDGEIVMEIVYEGDSSSDSTNTGHDQGAIEKRKAP